MSAFPPLDMVRGIIAEGKTVPWIAMAVLAAWAAIWFGYGYGYYEMAPRVAENTEEIGEVSGKLEKLKDKLDDVGEGVDRLTVSNVEKALLEARYRQCAAGTPESKQYWAGQVAAWKREYWELTGAQFHPPVCEEVQ